MSSSQEFSDRRSSGKGPERSNFAQTYNRLSQYLKEKRSLKDLGLEITGKLEPKGRSEITRGLFPVDREKPGETSAWNGFVDLFPQHAGVGCSNTSIIDLDSPEQSNCSEPAAMETEPKAAQMTIFYGGRVVVFDCVPADKAKELMLLASNESSPNSSAFLSTPQPEVITISDSVPSSSRTDLPNPTQEHLRPRLQTTGSDIPIARRSSLHRFFDKRKDRVTARAPYQVNGGPSSSSPKLDDLIDLNR
ncbi:protein TIFY 10b-like [Actinidia eriantha]|uniref:protein TIFY 10b-like n=1 Tax=Actinidia eriantha TaxID=165200 RepID=UPI00258EB624|nr:protein TIFY 10b-like [Actinidia eriantha]